MTKKCQCEYTLPMKIKTQVGEEEVEVEQQNAQSYRRCAVKDLLCFKKHKGKKY